MLKPNSNTPAINIAGSIVNEFSQAAQNAKAKLAGIHGVKPEEIQAAFDPVTLRTVNIIMLACDETDPAKLDRALAALAPAPAAAPQSK